ncbi:MAG: type II CAAX endopeptidase family protein [Nocardiopsaceae bacterium]|nr:type II CAAX endopeptidase family protein [Nocardiopsaceae bacterium]
MATTSVDRTDHPFIRQGASGARVTHPVLVIVLAQLLYLVGVLPGMLLLMPLAERLREASGPGAATAVIEIAAMLLNYVFPYVALWLWLRYVERRTFFSSTGFAFNRRALTGLLAGCGLALVFVAAWIGISLAAGTVVFEGALASGGAGMVWILVGGMLMLLLRIVMIGIEEQLYRGWMLQAVGLRWGRAAGVLVSSVFFALMHFFFIGTYLLPDGRSHEPHWVLMLNITLWAVFAALVTLRTGSLWAATGFHAAALILPGFLLGVFPAGQAEQAMGFLVFLIEEPGYYTGGAGFAGLFEGLPATLVLAVLVAGTAALERWRPRRHPATAPGQE